VTYHQSARVATDEPARFMKQLCRHFGHKLEVEWSEDKGSIVFTSGRCDLVVEPGVLALDTSSETEEGAAQVADVIASHLLRFGAKSNLEVEFAPVA
jgi:hypothetical protein